MAIELKTIGKIRTPWKTLAECPNNIQFEGPECQLELDALYQQEIRGLTEGDGILILYWLGDPAQPIWQPDLVNPHCRDTLKREREEAGTFALRSPVRPNPVGVAVVPIERIETGQLIVRGLDCLDGTGLLDIKPAIYREYCEIS